MSWCARHVWRGEIDQLGEGRRREGKIGRGSGAEFIRSLSLAMTFAGL